jgi:E3 ubiquitin-protein ligase SHPRH
MRALVPDEAAVRKPVRVTADTLAAALPGTPDADSKHSKDVLGAVRGVLDPQAALLWEWRAQLVAELTRWLSTNGHELLGADADADAVAQTAAADEDEYSRSLATQARAEVLLREYGAVLADRREILSGERNALAAHDFTVKKARKKRRRVPAGMEELEEEAPLELEQRPEDELLGVELKVQRNKVMEAYALGRSLRRMQGELGAVLSRSGSRQPKIRC